VADERIPLRGLTSQAEIRLDRWGVPHIRAENLADLFFAQGFNAGRDRLWQIDLWRKRGLGLLSADFGPGYLAQDRASRLFLYRGDMDVEWAAYGADARSICEAFVAGINAYVALTVREPDRLPPEFHALNTRPATWRADDVVRIRTHGWLRNVLSEVQRANVIARATAALDRLRIGLEPPVEPHQPADVDLSGIPLAVLDPFRLATAPVTFSRERLRASMDDAWRWSTVSPDGDVALTANPAGSNNWAVHGSRTTTGRAVLANDPHRAHAVPSLRYLVHLTSPELDVIGAVEPSFPGITIGHNGDAAFGLTLFLGPDQEDLYVYDTNPDDASAYRYNGAWEPLRTLEETFDVKGHGMVLASLAFTRHGPVLHQDQERCRVFALRSVWAEAGTAPYGAGLQMMRARTASEFQAALRLWGAPAVNQVYADRHGTIAWMTAGLVPVRRSWDGLLPVPGDGRYEWDGFLRADALPSSVNPDEAYVSSANAFNLPLQWDRTAAPLGYEWDDPSRRDRIRAVLARDRAHTVDASCRLQVDTVSGPAVRICALLRDVVSTDADGAKALGLLRTWDHDLRFDSRAAALFEVWWTRHLRPTLLARLVPDPTVRSLIGPGDVDVLLGVMEGSELVGFSNPAMRRLLASLAVTTLADAYRECVSLMGPDPAAWTWGRLHQWSVRHPLSPLELITGVPLDVGPMAVGGSESTVMKATYRPSDFRVTLGASVRLVIDVGDWDRSVWINAPGQSGDPRSVHYADLAPMWADGDYVPMAYSEPAVEAVTASRIVLVPEADS